MSQVVFSIRQYGKGSYVDRQKIRWHYVVKRSRSTCFMECVVWSRGMLVGPMDHIWCYCATTSSCCAHLLVCTIVVCSLCTLVIAAYHPMRNIQTCALVWHDESFGDGFLSSIFSIARTSHMAYVFACARVRSLAHLELSLAHIVAHILEGFCEGLEGSSSQEES